MYPPPHHLDNDRKKCWRVIETCRFATLISRTPDDVIVTHVPLVLERDGDTNGYLVGHMDRTNPHARHLDNAPVFAIFHGPNTYISPAVYETSQLPTWNSIAVHVRGIARIVEAATAVRDSLVRMTEVLEGGTERFVLEPDDARMAALLAHIVGFRIDITEMTGRFKLSQDKSTRDMELARRHLVAHSTREHAQLLDAVF